jgi:hypothetical protein
MKSILGRDKGQSEKEERDEYSRLYDTAFSAMVIFVSYRFWNNNKKRDFKNIFL